jgi:hypothetical protein
MPTCSTFSIWFGQTQRTKCYIVHSVKDWRTSLNNALQKQGISIKMIYLDLSNPIFTTIIYLCSIKVLFMMYSHFSGFISPGFHGASVNQSLGDFQFFLWNELRSHPRLQQFNNLATPLCRYTNKFFELKRRGDADTLIHWNFIPRGEDSAEYHYLSLNTNFCLNFANYEMSNLFMTCLIFVYFFF